MATKYLENKCTANVGLLDGRIFIPQGGVTPVSEEISELDDIIQAEFRGWIKIHHKNPEGLTPFVVEPLPFQNQQMAGSKYPPGKEPKEEIAAQTVTEEIPTEVKVIRQGKKKVDAGLGNFS